MFPARCAAPSPMPLKRTPKATETGTKRSVGSHRSRHFGSRRKANARMNGAANVTATVTRLSHLCAEECHESFVHRVSIPRQSSRKKPTRKKGKTSEYQCARADPSQDIRTERAPEPKAEE